MSKMQAEAAVAKIVQALVVAWNAHDARAFAGSFAEDADFTNVFGMHAKGRAMVEQFHRPIFETMFKDSQLTATDIRVRWIRPDVVAADVQWDDGRSRPDGQRLGAAAGADQHACHA